MSDNVILDRVIADTSRRRLAEVHRLRDAIGALSPAQWHNLADQMAKECERIGWDHPDAWDEMFINAVDRMAEIANLRDNMGGEVTDLTILRDNMPADADMKDCKDLGCAISRAIGYAHDKYRECEDLKGELEFYREQIKKIDYRGIADGLIYLNKCAEGGHGVRPEYIERLLEPLAVLYRDYLFRSKGSN